VGAGPRPTGSPSNTVWHEPRPTSLSSGTLIHPTVWPQLQECHAPPRRNTLTDYFYACVELLLDTNQNQVNNVLQLSGKHFKLWEIYTLISPF